MGINSRFAQAKKCSNEGRALMQLDFQQFRTQIERMSKIRWGMHCWTEKCDHITSTGYYATSTLQEGWTFRFLLYKQLYPSNQCNMQQNFCQLWSTLVFFFLRNGSRYNSITCLFKRSALSREHFCWRWTIFCSKAAVGAVLCEVDILVLVDELIMCVESCPIAMPLHYKHCFLQSGLCHAPVCAYKNLNYRRVTKCKQARFECGGCGCLSNEKRSLKHPPLFCNGCTTDLNKEDVV